MTGKHKLDSDDGILKLFLSEFLLGEADNVRISSGGKPIILLTKILQKLLGNFAAKFAKEKPLFLVVDVIRIPIRKSKKPWWQLKSPRIQIEIHKETQTNSLTYWLFFNLLSKLLYNHTWCIQNNKIQKVDGMSLNGFYILWIVLFHEKEKKSWPYGILPAD